MDVSKYLQLLLSIPLATACTVVSVDSKSGPARIESRGLIDGHVAVGIPSEDHLLHFDLFDGTSDGAVAELVVWKLLRLEAGLAGASLSLGPLHLGLGVLAYEPVVPATDRRGRHGGSVAGEDDDASEPWEECEECREARGD